MVNQNMMELLVKLRGDYTDLLQGAQRMRNEFSQLKLGSDLTKELSEGFNDVFDSFAAYEKRIQNIDKKGINESTIKGLVQESKLLQKKLKELYTSWDKISDVDIAKSFKAASPEITKLRNDILDINKSLAQVFSQQNNPIISQLTGAQTKLNSKTVGYNDIASIIKTLTQDGDIVLATDQLQKLEQRTQSLATGFNTTKTKAEALKTQLEAERAALISSGQATDEVDKKIAAQTTKIEAAKRSYKNYSDVLKIVQDVQKSLGQDQTVIEALRKIGLAEADIKKLADALLRVKIDGTQGLSDALKQLGIDLTNTQGDVVDTANATIRANREVEQLISRFTRFTTLVGIFDIFRRAVKSAFNSVKELDRAMNSIAVVTDMTTKDLWDQIDAYTEMANATGSTITGAYQVAQLYYQQGNVKI